MADEDVVVKNIKLLQGLLSDKAAIDSEEPSSGLIMPDDISCITENTLPFTDIEELESNDVLFDSYKKLLRSDNRAGNQRFLCLINDYAERFRLSSSQEEKDDIVATIVLQWRSLDHPAGRFLVATKPKGTVGCTKSWNDIGDEEARRRTLLLLKKADERKHRDDATASTVSVSTSSWSRRSLHYRDRDNNRHSGNGNVNDCFGESIRAAVMSLFVRKGNGSIIFNQ